MTRCPICGQKNPAAAFHGYRTCLHESRPVCPCGAPATLYADRHPRCVECTTHSITAELLVTERERRRFARRKLA